MTTHDLEKALEIWTLQNILNLSLVLGLLALALSLIQPYYRSLERHLTLRVSRELWNLLTVMAVDVLLALVAITGYLVLNPDIMADIKIAVPFQPVATVLFTLALVLRLFHGGHQVGAPNHLRAVWLMFAANVLTLGGFTFVMEAPGEEYLADHPSAFWTFVKTHLRSNAAPDGLELAQITFYICFTALVLIYIWGFSSALKQLKSKA